MAPVLDVLGIGAEDKAVPPVAVVYHFNEEPVADSAVAVAPEQYSTGELTIGAAGVGLMITVIEFLSLSQPNPFVWLT